MFRRSQILFLFILALTAAACSGGMRPQTPLDTLKAYHLAIIKKDATTMKSLLSKESIKMAEEEAKAQNISLDEVILRETMFPEGQKIVKFRDEKIEGDKASIYMLNPMGTWDMVPFIKEGGYWKIDKAGFANDLERQIQEDQKKLDDEINKGRIETEPAPVEPIAPGATPTPDNGLPDGMKPTP